MGTIDTQLPAPISASSQLFTALRYQESRDAAAAAAALESLLDAAACVSTEPEGASSQPVRVPLAAATASQPTTAEAQVTAPEEQSQSKIPAAQASAELAPACRGPTVQLQPTAPPVARVEETATSEATSGGSSDQRDRESKARAPTASQGPPSWQAETRRSPSIGAAEAARADANLQAMLMLRHSEAYSDFHNNNHDVHGSLYNAGDLPGQQRPTSTSGDRQQLVGRFETEEAAARAYDDAVRRLYGKEAYTNFSMEEDEAPAAASVQRVALPVVAPALVAPTWVQKKESLARTGSGKGSSKFRGVSWHKDNMKWRATIFKGNKPVHIGYFEGQEEAARAYDREALKLRGPNTLLNFPLSTYAITPADVLASWGFDPNLLAQMPADAPRPAPAAAPAQGRHAAAPAPASTRGPPPRTPSANMREAEVSRLQGLQFQETLLPQAAWPYPGLSQSPAYGLLSASGPMFGSHMAPSRPASQTSLQRAGSAGAGLFRDGSLGQRNPPSARSSFSAYTPTLGSLPSQAQQLRAELTALTGEADERLGALDAMSIGDLLRFNAGHMVQRPHHYSSHVAQQAVLAEELAQLSEAAACARKPLYGDLSRTGSAGLRRSQLLASLDEVEAGKPPEADAAELLDELPRWGGRGIRTDVLQSRARTSRPPMQVRSDGGRAGQELLLAVAQQSQKEQKQYMAAADAPNKKARLI
ncbi:hypothetical protein WJX72_008699 [[Myrmecia] bisecta]|uniref:AP2/ERF domain-containing protein n=1 Tax=[Myrmecia] bisecta TaxID=41462 RepID=A0AAW1PKL1_9CHLO